MSTINMRELTRNTKSVVEEVVRSGRPAIVTVNGRPQVAVTPLVGAVEAAEEHVLQNASPELQTAIREGEADLISGRVARVDESTFDHAAEQELSEATSLAEVERQLDAAPLRDAVRRASSSSEAVEEVRRGLMVGEVLTIGFPPGEHSSSGRAVRSGIVTYTDDDSASAGTVLMPVFTTIEVVRSALAHHRDWQSLTVLLVSGKNLVENVDPDVTLVVDPWSDDEFRIPPTDWRRVSLEQAVVAPAELFAPAR